MSPARTTSLVAAIVGLCTATASLGNASPLTISLQSDSCVARSIGLGVEHANWIDAAFIGRSLAQVFTAPDTLIRAITVWRQPDQFELTVPMHLFVGATEPTDSLRPRPIQPLHDGPVIVLHGTSDVARPVRFQFDPPLSLPGVGKYFFAIKEDWCDAAVVLLADSAGSYQDGDAWMVIPFPSCEGLGGHANYLDGIDLIFEVEFCDLVVGATRRTWGSIKAAYR